MNVTEEIEFPELQSSFFFLQELRQRLITTRQHCWSKLARVKIVLRVWLPRLLDIALAVECYEKVTSEHAFSLVVIFCFCGSFYFLWEEGISNDILVRKRNWDSATKQTQAVINIWAFSCPCEAPSWSKCWVFGYTLWYSRDNFWTNFSHLDSISFVGAVPFVSLPIKEDH